MQEKSSTISNFRLNRRQAMALSAMASGAAATGGVRAQDATPVADSGTPAAAGGVTTEVVLTGLLDPRYVAFYDGALYFTESGSGGDTPVVLNVGEGTPPADPISMVGNTGTLSRLEADGSVTKVVSDFASYTFGGQGEIVGAAGLAFDGAGKAYVAVGAPGPFIAALPRTGGEGVVFEVDLATGEKRIVADLLRYELDNDPDPMTIDSNLYGMAYQDGMLYVADSGGNDVLSVNAADGTIATFAVTGGLEAPFMVDGNPNRKGEQAIDSVPSSVTIGPDGRIYVSFVTGGPFPEGFAPVYAYTADGSMEVVATGLTMVGDVQFSSDGTMYACIMSRSFVKQQPGVIVRVSPDGNHTVVVEGLTVPNGMAFDENDDLYVLTGVSMVPGGGSLIKISGVTTTAGRPLIVAGAGESSADGAATPESATPATGASEPIQVGFEDTFFDKTEISIPADTDVTFVFTNHGFLPHDFQIDEPYVFSGVLMQDESATIVVNLPAGEYTYYCTQVGHRALGMVGVLTVG